MFAGTHFISLSVLAVSSTCFSDAKKLLYVNVFALNKGVRGITA